MRKLAITPTWVVFHLLATSALFATLATATVASATLASATLARGASKGSCLPAMKTPLLATLARSASKGISAHHDGHQTPLLALRASESAPLLALWASEGEATGEDAAVKSGREAFRRGVNGGWYDHQRDRARARGGAQATEEELSAEKKNGDPSAKGKGNAKSGSGGGQSGSGKTGGGRARSRRSSSGETDDSSSSGFSGGAGLASLLQIVGLVMLVALLVSIVLLIARYFLNREIKETGVKTVVKAARAADRVAELPFQVKRAAGDFLDEARRLYQAGQYSDAILYYYSFLLVQLDKAQVIRLAKGRTNRQYLREARVRPILSNVLEIAMVAFEDVFFGHHDLTRERFEAAWRRLDEFQLELTRSERAAA